MTKELLPYFNNDELAASTWLNKYAKKNNGIVSENTPDDMHRRLAKEFFRIDNFYATTPFANRYKELSHYGKIRKSLTEESIYELFKNFLHVIPGGSVMASLGTGSLTSLSNCFVIASPKDSYTSIMKARTEQIHLMKRRGGVGYDLSNLRPAGTPVSNAAGSATGPSSFMEVCSDITKEVAQGGRRGALMLSLHMRHPDSLSFIEMKQDLTKVTGANISVKVPDDFMRAVEQDSDYLLRWPVHKEFIQEYPTTFEYGVLTPVNHGDGTITYVKRVKARELWNKLIHCAWNTAEPGILFIDRMHNYSPDGVYPDAKAVSTNPCGEIPLGPYDSCRLIHLNLTSFIDDAFTSKASWNSELLYQIAYETTILADDLVILEMEAVDAIIDKALRDGDTEEEDLWLKIRDTAVKYRRVGIGFTGLADAIAKLLLSYGSEDSLTIINDMMSVIFLAELNATIDMALTRGRFPKYDKGLEADGNAWYQFVQNHFPDEYDRMMKWGRRNLSFSTVAPTGTVSIMAGVSSGIEPVFMPYYMRRRKVSNPNDRIDFVDQTGEKFTEFPVIHTTFMEWIKHTTSMTYEEIRALSQTSLQKLFEESPWYGSTASEIDWDKRVFIQSTVQKYVTHAISSTVNMPEETTEEEVNAIYYNAWRAGLKGITVYRNNCRQGILNAQKKTTEGTGRQALKRPKTLEADYYQVKSKGKQYIVLVGLLNNRPYEIFTFEPLKPVNIEPHKGVITKERKGHYSFNSQFINISDLQLSTSNIEEKACTLYASMLLRHGAKISFIIKTSKKVNENITSFSSAMCRVLAKYVEKGEVTGEVCPECGGKLIREGGCDKCLDCSYSKCL